MPQHTFVQFLAAVGAPHEAFYVWHASFMRTRRHVTSACEFVTASRTRFALRLPWSDALPAYDAHLPPSRARELTASASPCCARVAPQCAGGCAGGTHPALGWISMYGRGGSF
eukprot:365490-Chlamydomonas_euryale.AAC.1